ncbi:MAG: efflux RND transporter permease subunit [Xanthomonadales bacterium]|nr:efflux RND transporter permease subunit [Xanthomonadales bacterium]
MLTLFASWAMGFTINRVSLFALIFSIGILVDDAIVVVENIHRHQRLGATRLREVIRRQAAKWAGRPSRHLHGDCRALLPMAFVSGLMGPYMRPIRSIPGRHAAVAGGRPRRHAWLALRLFACHAPGS